MAQDLYHKLSLLGINAFFSHASMKQHGDPSFESAIHDALESSEIFVAVGSDKFHMNSRWVKYERETFHAMMMSGVKGEKAGIYSYIAPDFSVSDLPPMLSSYNAYSALASMKTTNGAWEMGVYTSDNMYFTYTPDTNYNSGTNNGYS
jgi:hypothetical protein